MTDCKLRVSLFLSFLGSVFGFSAFLVFTFYYGNVPAGLFALLSGKHLPTFKNNYYLKVPSTNMRILPGNLYFP